MLIAEQNGQAAELAAKLTVEPAKMGLLAVDGLGSASPSPITNSVSSKCQAVRMDVLIGNRFRANISSNPFSPAARFLVITSKLSVGCLSLNRAAKLGAASDTGIRPAIRTRGEVGSP